MDFRETLIIVLSGMIGTVGFSILFKSDKKYTLSRIFVFPCAFFPMIRVFCFSKFRKTLEQFL